MDLGVDTVSFAHIDEDTDENNGGYSRRSGCDRLLTLMTGVRRADCGFSLADSITGSSGRDMIVGGDGDDTLNGAVAVAVLVLETIFPRLQLIFL